jgi:hypothetical protein
MSRMRLIFVALGALSVLALAAPAAQAQGTLAVASCTLSPGGVTGTAGVDNIVGDVGDPGGPLDTDDGTFDFDGTATCAGADVAGPATVPPGTYTIAADGTYENLLCGTGTANGSATLSATVAGNNTRVEADFGLTFAAGTGKLTIVVKANSQVQVGPNIEIVAGGEGSGAINIIPNPQAAGGNCVTTNVTSFFVNGGFETTLTG